MSVGTKTPNYSHKVELRVSVIICTYNHANFIGRSIESVLDQSLPLSEYEIVVVNDGCTDHTMDILRKYEGLIRIIDNNGNRGVVYSCNKAIENAYGTYAIRVDSDDAIDRNTLLFKSSILDANNDIGFVYSDRFELDCSSNIKKRVSLEKFDLFKTVACGIMFRTQKLREIGGYNDLFFEEYDLLLRYITKSSGYYIKVPFYSYYFHGANTMLDQEKISRGKKELVEKWGLNELKKWGYREDLFSHESHPS